ncbi:ABC transporter permease [Undibacter mobilis]|uniref:Iron ABC transporter permease n=1 Tax=Undibacter mobilis TaxID=2292256 RepID=A0A371BAJ2_9BRAD|nr:iron ABC transporter permease [Undibacter mobilis]RDV04616.1 iron ABC transporter permease [Undibacter mobilis]
MYSVTGGPALRGAAGRLPADRIASLTIALAAAALIALPLASLMRLAVAGDAELWPHLIAYVLPHAVVQTALLLAGVAAVTALTGIAPAFLVAGFEFPGRKVLEWLLPLPLAIPTYIAAYVYADLLDAAGPVQSALRAIFGFKTGAEYWFPPVRSLPGAILIVGIVVYPYVYLTARALFKTQSASFADAARTMGATLWQTFRYVSLPLARPAIAVGLALALLEALNDIGAAEYLGVQTLTLSIFTTWLNRGSLGGAAQIALALLAVVTLLIVLERTGRRGQSVESDVQDGAVTRRLPLTGRAGWIAACVCVIPVLFGFVIPGGYLLREAIMRGLILGIDPSLFTALMTTVALAAVATAVVLAVGIAAAIPLRLAPVRAARPLLALASMGYAVPGTVLALGLMSPLVAGDEMLNWLSGKLSGTHVGLVLAGSSFALIVAYTARFASIAIGVVQAGLAQMPHEFDESARLEGAGIGPLLRHIHLPLLTPALTGAALLVFVDCLKELPMTLLMRPLNVETLATSIYQYATRGNFEDGALAALLIVLAGIPPVILLMRLPDARETRR